MSNALRDFASKALETKRLGFADLRRLQRDILPQRLTTREEAELLLAIDGALVRADRDWSNYLVSAVGQFVVWGSEPIGHVNQSKVEWLLAALSTARRKTAAAIIRDVTREAPQLDHPLRMPAQPREKAAQELDAGRAEGSPNPSAPAGCEQNTAEPTFGPATPLPPPAAMVSFEDGSPRPG
jgi:hypothetical protein